MTITQYSPQIVPNEEGTLEAAFRFIQRGNRLIRWESSFQSMPVRPQR